MAHDQDVFLCSHDLAKCVCLYAGLNSCVFLYLLALSAIIGYCFRRLYNCLISASSKSQIDGISGKFIILCVCETVHAETDTDGHCHLVSDINGLDILQEFKM